MGDITSWQGIMGDITSWQGVMGDISPSWQGIMGDISPSWQGVMGDITSWQGVMGDISPSWQGVMQASYLSTATACAGDAIGVTVRGSSNDQVLATLNSRFCGCTYITGSLTIQLTPGPSSLTEDSFNALYYLKEISGSLQFSDIPQVASITLPNLRIIRGQSTLTSDNGPVALVVENSYIGSLNLPHLTEISYGGAAFVSTNGMCGFINVNWNDILNNGQLDYSMSGCTFPNSSKPTHL